MKKALKIFLSSTVKDLAPEREMAARAIETLKLEAIRAETFGSIPRTPLETCGEMVRECDVFIGIYGGRYGYVPSGEIVSVTEMEFQEARRVGKDILVYIKADVEVDAPQGEFLRRADDFQGGYFRRPPFRTLSELEEWIKEDLIALLSSRFVTTALPKATTTVEEYRSYIAALYKNMSFAGLAQTPSGLSLPIDDVFVNPLFRELEPSGEVFSETKKLGEILFHSRRRTLIVGSPGTGKTLLLKNLARTLAEPVALIKEGLLLPVLVPFVSLVGSNSSERLDKRICRFIGSRTQAQFEPVIDGALRSGTAVLMLDGLDEIDKPELVDPLISELEAFCRTYPDVRVLLTTRPSGGRSIADFINYEILPWTNEQISQFARQWSAALDKDLELTRQSDERERQFLDAIMGHRDLLEIARNPLFLTLLAFLHRQAYRLPTRRVELYDAIVKTMVDSWDRARSLSHTLPRILEHTQVDTFLSTVAYEMTMKGVHSITAPEIEAALMTNSAVEIIADEIPSFLAELVNRIGLLREEREGRYSFVHLSFQEFFAAKALAEFDDEELLRFTTEHFFNPQYEEVIRLALSWISVHDERHSLVARAAEELLNGAQA